MAFVSGAVRLVSANVYGEGYLEVYDNLREDWGRICPANWDMSDANVACKQLGFREGAASGM